MASRTMVVLFDVDNTLLDNDGVTTDLKQHWSRKSVPSGNNSIGIFSNSCAMTWAMSTIWVRCSGIVGNIRAIRIS